MDSCFIDVTVEFLSIAFHNILYYASIYPESIFETRRKYSVVVYRSIHPEINQYIDLCLKSISECMKIGKLNRIEFAITNENYEPLITFVFDLEKNDVYDETADAYLVQAEQNLRAFCLNLASASCKFKNLPEDCSFTIYLHTNESTAVTMANDANLQDFPLIEVEKKEENAKIIPLRRIPIRNFNLDTYIEMK